MEKVFLEMSQNSQASAATLLKKRLWHRCFPVNFAKFLRTAVFIEHLCGCFWSQGDLQDLQEQVFVAFVVFF